MADTKIESVQTFGRKVIIIEHFIYSLYYTQCMYVCVALFNNVMMINE